MRLNGEILPVAALSYSQKERMFELMTLYFDGVYRGAFNKDLYEKEWVIILKDSISGQIQGFSTQMILEDRVDGIRVKAIFSGDTIVHKDYWGETQLFRAGLKFAISLIQKFNGVKLYWFLISMGYKTYRFLPLYFHEFYPRYDSVTPDFAKMVLDTFGFKKYPLGYDRETGTIHHDKPKEILKPGVADVTTQRLKNPHINFFVTKNPFYIKGEELACIAEVSEKNFKPTAIRLISGNSLSGG